MFTNRLKSPWEFLPKPSDIFEGIETDDLLNCDVNPYFSSSGKEDVARYISVTNSMDCCQIFKSRNVLIIITYFVTVSLRYFATVMIQTFRRR